MFLPKQLAKTVFYGEEHMWDNMSLDINEHVH